MNNSSDQGTPKRNGSSFGAIVKETFSSSGKKLFPWYQTGLVLVGFAAGVLVATVIDMALRSEDTTDKSPKTVTAAEKCKDDGGVYDRDSEGCLYTTEDRGDGCQKNSDCQGWCLVSDEAKVGSKGEGECSENFNPKGCFKFMDNGIVNSICMP